MQVKGNWQVTTLCPVHKKQVLLIVDAPNIGRAKEKVLGTTVQCPWDKEDHTFVVEEVLAVSSYPWIPKEVVTRPVVGIKPKVPVVTEPIRITKAKRFPDSVAVVLMRGKERVNVIYPVSAVRFYDRLMRIAKATGNATLKNAVLAHLIAHGSTSKTLATAFLNATDFPVATTSTCGEALSRLVVEGVIAPHSGTIYVRTLHPLGFYGKMEKQEVASLLGERLYRIHPDIRTEAKTRLKLEKTFAWYNPRFLKHPPVTPELLRKPVEYEWVTIGKPTPRFQSAQDYKSYGPYKPGEMAKVPLVNAYLLVRTNHANWMNPQKETVVDAEKAFQFVKIEKIRRQATLQLPSP